MILTSEQRIGTFGLKGNFEDLVTERQGVRRLQTFTEQKESKEQTIKTLKKGSTRTEQSLGRGNLSLTQARRRLALFL